MRDYKQETEKRVDWIKTILNNTKAKGVVIGNSGGKDSALVIILCKMATENILGVIMPCGSKQNYGSDKDDALRLSENFGIKSTIVDLTDTKKHIVDSIESSKCLENITETASKNIAPRLRMTTLYTIGQSLNYLVAGTGNKSEYFTGYFTKWGDGGYDFNPIADLTATEVFQFLEYLKAPKEIIKKAPSAGLYEGQTDEMEMGVSYDAIDEYINKATGKQEDIDIIKRMNETTAHKRALPKMYS